jgi:CP family cyanate transporter-like MFS transporter
MTFLVCYSAASLAPVVLGAVHDASGGYELPFALLSVIACVELALATRFRPGLRDAVV